MSFYEKTWVALCIFMALPLILVIAAVALDKFDDWQQKRNRRRND